MNLSTIFSLSLASLSSACGDASVASEAAAAVSDDVWTQAELEQATAVIQAEVEKLRGETFKRSVAVEVTDKAGFLKYVLERVDQMGGEAKVKAEEDVSKMLGLVPPSMDVMEVSLRLLEDQVGGFYDPSSEKFYLMESFTGEVARIILAHELTHALDDQYFDIDGSLEKLLDDRDASAAYHAVVEGSGTAMMALWQREYMGDMSLEDQMKMAEMSTQSMDGVPATLWKPLLASYQQGQAFLNKGYRLMKKQGKTMTEVTRMAFEHPPMTTEQLLHPEKYWDDERRDDPILVRVEARSLPAGWTLVESSTIGELMLALMTEEEKEIDFTNPMSVMSIAYTNEAAMGWGGDRIVLYGKDGARFLNAVTFWDTEDDAREFDEAMRARLDAWRKDLSELNAGGAGSNVVIDSDFVEKRVTLSSWFGVDAETAQALMRAQAVSISESVSPLKNGDR